MPFRSFVKVWVISAVFAAVYFTSLEGLAWQFAMMMPMWISNHITQLFWYYMSSMVMFGHPMVYFYSVLFVLLPLLNLFLEKKEKQIKIAMAVLSLALVLASVVELVTHEPVTAETLAEVERNRIQELYDNYDSISPEDRLFLTFLEDAAVEYSYHHEAYGKIIVFLLQNGNQELVEDDYLSLIANILEVNPSDILLDWTIVA